MSLLSIVVDSRLRLFLDSLTPEVADEIRAAFTHDNPQHALKRALGIPAWSEPKVYRTWKEEDGAGRTMLTLPRGGMARLRAILAAHGLERNVIDRRTTGRVSRAGFIPATKVILRPYQEDMIASAIRRENCLLRAGTGSGKTTAAIALASRLGLYTLVIVWSGNLFDQWVERIERELGIPEKEIGKLRASARNIRPITVAMQQTIAARGVDDELAETFGVVICDEVQRFAAKTLFDAVDAWPAKYRIGVSADESRKDRKEFLIYDLFGSVAADVKREDLVQEGSVLEVEIRVVPTRFQADWYRESRDFNALLAAMMDDAEREDLLIATATEIVGTGQQVMILSHRREHCTKIANLLTARGIRSGLLLGGDVDSVEFAATKRGLDSGAIMAGVGTIQAIAQGLDIPRIARMLVATPLAANRQLFGQARGRVCRPAPNKPDAALIYLWDRAVYGAKHLENLCKWNTRVLVRQEQEWIPGKDYLRRMTTEGMDEASLNFDFLLGGANGGK